MTKTLKNLIIFASFAIFFVFANSVSAYVPGLYEPERSYYYTGSNSAAFTEIPAYSNYGNSPTQYVPQATKTVYVPGPTNTVYVPTSTNTVYVQTPAKTVYAQAPANTIYVQTPANTVYTQAPSNTLYVPTANTTSYNNGVPVNTLNTSVPNYDNSNVNTDRYNENLTASVYDSQRGNNQLSALAFNGTGSFMPSSVWQWIIVVFLILVIVIIIRVMMKKPAVTEVHHMSPSH